MDHTIAEGLGPDDPREIGQFTIIGLLGTGGMGEVYLGATDSEYVAIKRVWPRLVSSERFKREVCILFRVPAGVAPSVLAADSTLSRPWFATEYVAGLTVAEAVRLHGPLPAETLWLLLAETAVQLKKVHETGISHRDLRPTNVMLVHDGVKLLDFGITRAVDQARVTSSGSGSGVRAFRAPELDDSAPDMASPVDVYSLGALLLYAATARTPGAVLDIEPVRIVDSDLADIIGLCLGKDPGERPTAAALAASAREHSAASNVFWPIAIMERIAARREFAAMPVGRLETLPRPELEHIYASAEAASAAASWLFALVGMAFGSFVSGFFSGLGNKTREAVGRLLKLLRKTPRDHDPGLILPGGDPPGANQRAGHLGPRERFNPETGLWERVDR